MGTKQFKAESKRLLDLMINSIYTHKEIFLRELISNASDAMDKLYYRSLTADVTGVSREDFTIQLTADKDNRILTLEDNGIGMTKDELEKNLGYAEKDAAQRADLARLQQLVMEVRCCNTGLYTPVPQITRDTDEMLAIIKRLNA